MEDPIRSLLLLAWVIPGSLAHAEETSKPFVCCDSPAITATVSAYLDLHEVLTKPSSTHLEGQEAVRALSLRVRSQRGLEKPDRTAMQALRKEVDAASGQSLSAVREAFDPISRLVIFLALRHPGGDLHVAEAWCPHVGPWLQRDLTTLAAPYGDRCGRWQ